MSVFCVVETAHYTTDAGTIFAKLGFAQSATLIFDVDTLPTFGSRIKTVLEYGVSGEAREDLLLRRMRVGVFVCVRFPQDLKFPLRVALYSRLLSEKAYLKGIAMSN
jgi:hypothetical protein